MEPMGSVDGADLCWTHWFPFQNTGVRATGPGGVDGATPRWTQWCSFQNAGSRSMGFMRTVFCSGGTEVRRQHFHGPELPA